MSRLFFLVDGLAFCLLALSTSVSSVLHVHLRHVVLPAMREGFSVAKATSSWCKGGKQ